VAFKLTTNARAQAPKFKQNLAGLGERFQGAMVRAAHRAAAMMEEKGRADIASAGNFGGLWVSGLKARVEGEGQKNMRISMTHDDPRADFREGRRRQRQPASLDTP
jgi:hypothetical protein